MSCSKPVLARQGMIVFFCSILGGGGLLSSAQSNENINVTQSIEVVEDKTWVKKEEVEKTKIYNNGIKETIIINKATGHISIDMRRVKAKPKPKKKPPPRKKTKVDKKEISAANMAMKSAHSIDNTGLVVLQKDVAKPKIKRLANNQDLIDEMIDALRKNHPQLSDTITSVDGKKKTQAVATPIEGAGAVLSSETKKMSAHSFTLSRTKLARKIEKRKRLARQKIQAEYEARKEKRFSKVQKKYAKRINQMYKNIAYTCRSEGQRIKMEINFDARSEQKICELWYFKSNSFTPINIGEFPSSQCDAQAKRWLDKQKAWGWQCDAV